jgi:hypothetical protein
MHPDDLDVPLAFLSDALEALEELPKGQLPEEQATHLNNLHVRLQALINSAEMLQRRLSTGRRTRKAQDPIALPVEDADL